MKRLFITILTVGIAVGTFAQTASESETENQYGFKHELAVDINPSFIQATVPTGDDAPDGDGTFDLFTPNDHWGQANELRFSLSYTKEYFGAYVRLNADNLIQTGGDMIVGDGTFNLNRIFSGDAINIDEWFFRGTVGRFTAFAGNTDDRGVTDPFQNFEDIAIGLINYDSFGVMTPGAINGEEFSLGFFGGPNDTNNFNKSQEISGVFGQRDQSYFSISANFAPFTIQAALDIGDNSGIDASRARFRANGGFRVSGEKIADMVSFDAIYKFKGGDDTTNSNDDPDGQGVSVHSFGVYANLFVVDNLGIGLGYTGLVRGYEDASSSTKQAGPYFNGIDLRFQFTGVDRFRFTLNNNISFSIVNGDTPSDRIVYGLLGEGSQAEPNILGNNVSESWFSLYNALGVDYSLTEALTLSAQLANALGIYNRDDDGSESEVIGNTFVAGIFASYAFNSNVTLQGGLRFGVLSTTTEYNGNAGGDSGEFRFAIPIRLRIVY